MKLTKPLIATIRDIVSANDLDFDHAYVGIRVQDRPFELGKIDHVSHVWDDGDDTGEELSGICVTSVKALDDLLMAFGAYGEYEGEHMAIIVGDSATYGEDIGELVIEDAEVAAIIA